MPAQLLESAVGRRGLMVMLAWTTVISSPKNHSKPVEFSTLSLRLRTNVLGSTFDPFCPALRSYD